MDQRMDHRTHRRRFLTHSLVAGAAAATITPNAIASQFGLDNKYKLSLAAYSYRNLLKSDDFELSHFIKDCAKFGLEGTELTSYYFPDPVTPEYLRQLKRECFRAGLDVSGTAIRNDFGFRDGPERKKEIDWVKQWIRHAEILGAPVIRVFAGKQKAGISDKETHDLIVSGLQECCDFAAQHGIHLALENHGGPTATVEGLLALVNGVDSPWFGVNLDTGNFHTDNIYEDLAKAAAYAVNVQVKVVTSGPDKKRAPTDFARIAKILRDANYRGYVVLEYEEKDDPRSECPRYLAEMRKVFS